MLMQYKKNLHHGDLNWIQHWGPVYTYPYSFENATFFLRFPSTGIVFASFSPVHTYTINRFENDNLTAHARRMSIRFYDDYLD